MDSLPVSPKAMGRYPFFIGLRYALSRQRGHLVAFISRVSMLGMSVAVALLILVLSVMNGFDYEMRHRILGLVPHITVYYFGATPDWTQAERAAAEIDGVVASAPFVQLNAMLLRGTTVEGVLVYGVDAERESRVSIIEQYMRPAALAALAANPHGIIVGAALAEHLNIEAGDTVNLMVPRGSSSQSIDPVFVRYQLIDVFDTGTEVDQATCLINIDSAAALLSPSSGQYGLRIRIEDTFDAPRIGWQLDQRLPNSYLTRDWTMSHGNLYAAIELSRQMVALLLLGIIAVAAFNVVSALIMVVTDKRGDIAIMRSCGASRTTVMAVFMVQGSMIGLIGTLVGVVFGVLFSLSISDLVVLVENNFNFKFLHADVYPVNYLPSDLRLTDVLAVAGAGLTMSVLATIYPAWRAAATQPAQALRYE